MNGQTFGVNKTWGYLLVAGVASIVFLFQAFSRKDYRMFRLASLVMAIGTWVSILGTIIEGDFFQPIGATGYGVAGLGLAYGLYISYQRTHGGKR